MPRPPMAHIAAVVAVETGIAPDAMRSRTRARIISAARFEAMRRAKDAGYTLGQIGFYFGGRDHTSVLYAVRRAEARKAAENG